ncbi:hypothetical protein [Thermococcus peptonophilus]
MFHNVFCNLNVGVIGFYLLELPVGNVEDALEVLVVDGYAMLLYIFYPGF